MRIATNAWRPLFGLALMLAGGIPLRGQGAAADDHFLNLLRPPDAVTVVTESGSTKTVRNGDSWTGDGAEITAAVRPDGLHVELAALKEDVRYLVLRWNGPLPADWKYLGDAWETVLRRPGMGAPGRQSGNALVFPAKRRPDHPRLWREDGPGGHVRLEGRYRGV